MRSRSGEAHGTKEVRWHQARIVAAGRRDGFDRAHAATGEICRHPLHEHASKTAIGVLGIHAQFSERHSVRRYRRGGVGRKTWKVGRRRIERVPDDA